MVVIYAITANCCVWRMRKPYCSWGHANMKLDAMHGYDTIPLTPNSTAFAYTYIYLRIYSLIYISPKSKVLKATITKVTVSWDVTPCSLGEVHQRESSSETLENFYHTTRCHIPNDSIPLTFICSFQVKYLSVTRQVNSLFQTEFSKECDLELPPSTSSIFLFP
jgi:hypothetical protein